MGEWHNVMKAEDLWEDEMACVSVNGTRLLLVNSGGELRAYKGICPHQMTELTEDDFEPEEALIICPSHQWEFDALSGKSVNPKDSELTRYDIDVRDGDVWVRI